MSATCPACGSPFRPQRSTARFCSPRCRKVSQRARDRGTPIKVAATRPGVATDAVLSVTLAIGMSEGQKSQSVTLRRKPAKLDPRIVSDTKWPGMHRIKRPDGSLSDMANLTRCRDALRSFDEAAAAP
jgi:predicted nucleic acid-binding Zn ribbon protein